MSRNTWKILSCICLVAVGLHAQAPNRANRTVAITIDDLVLAAGTGNNPTLEEATSVNDALLRAFAKYGVRAVGFVNEKTLHVGGDYSKYEEILDRWLREGHELGNHTYSHENLGDTDEQAFEQDTIRGEETIKTLIASRKQKLRWFRYPFNSMGSGEKRVSFQKFLKSRGYEVGTCTVHNSDWVFADVYAHALKTKDTEKAARVRKDYLTYTEAMFEHYEQRAKTIFGREIPLVMLDHINRLNADTMEELITLMEKRGYRFVTLAKAQSDVAYQSPDGYDGNYGWMWTERWAKGKNMKAYQPDEPEIPKWIADEYASITSK